MRLLSPDWREVDDACTRRRPTSVTHQQLALLLSGIKRSRTTDAFISRRHSDPTSHTTAGSRRRHRAKKQIKNFFFLEPKFHGTLMW